MVAVLPKYKRFPEQHRALSAGYPPTPPPSLRRKLEVSLVDQRHIYVFRGGGCSIFQEYLSPAERRSYFQVEQRIQQRVIMGKK